MGLDTTHNCWHGSYSSFNTFRYDLARQIGINLDDYQGYNCNGIKLLEEINHDIMPLLNHSDCDGELKPEELRLIANGLNNILNNIKTDVLIETLRFEEKIKLFRDGCLLALANSESVLFE